MACGATGPFRVLDIQLGGGRVALGRRGAVRSDRNGIDLAGLASLAVRLATRPRGARRCGAHPRKPIAAARREISGLHYSPWCPMETFL